MGQGGGRAEGRIKGRTEGKDEAYADAARQNKAYFKRMLEPREKGKDFYEPPPDFQPQRAVIMRQPTHIQKICLLFPKVEFPLHAPP